MQSPRLAALTALALVGAAALTVTLYAQHSFPVRFGDEEPERVSAAATTSAGVTVTDVVTLTPQDAPPFDCAPATLGALYVQNDVCGGVSFTDTVLCMCTAQTAGADWYYVNGGTACSIAYDCP